MNEPLTEIQIENWRNAMAGTLGPWAYLMPVEDIEKMRNAMQERFAGEEQP